MVTLTFFWMRNMAVLSRISTQKTQLEISRAMIRTGHLNRAHLIECLNGDCPSLNAYDAIRTSLNIRPGNGACVVVAGVTPRRGAWESHVQGEGRQIFQLSAVGEEHEVQDPNVLLTMLMDKPKRSQMM
jgi:hypothetical protein